MIDLVPQVELDGDAIGTLQALKQAREQIGKWTEVKEACEKRLKTTLADAASGTFQGKPLVTYAVVTSTVLDQKALREDHPDLAAHYMTVRETRPFKPNLDALEEL